jgi:hypothetical protein
MDFDNDYDPELSSLMEQQGVSTPIQSGRVNPVQRQLQRQQPQPGPFQPNNWTPNMPANGGYKKKRTKKNSKKYKNKNKNCKRRRTRRVIKMK